VAEPRPRTLRYDVLAEPVRAETDVLGSRFIASLGATETEADAQAFVARIRGEFSDATHNCWAYRVGPPGSRHTIGFSDDGEPHQTAGRPMFDVLMHAPVGDLVAVVTRYFGGRKLGRGGLVRAYGGAVRAALEQANLRPKIHWVELEISAAYAHADRLARLWPRFEGEVLNAEFAARAVYRVRVPRERLEALEAELRDETRGQAEMSSIDPDG